MGGVEGLAGPGRAGLRRVRPGVVHSGATDPRPGGIRRSLFVRPVFVRLVLVWAASGGGLLDRRLRHWLSYLRFGLRVLGQLRFGQLRFGRAGFGYVLFSPLIPG